MTHEHCWYNFFFFPVESGERMSSCGAGWVLWLTPPQDHIRTAEPTVGLPRTRKTLTEWSKSCRVQKDGCYRDHVMNKKRLRNWGLFEITFGVKDWTQVSWWDLSQWFTSLFVKAKP